MPISFKFLFFAIRTSKVNEKLPLNFKCLFSKPSLLFSFFSKYKKHISYDMWVTRIWFLENSALWFLNLKMCSVYLSNYFETGDVFEILRLFKPGNLNLITVFGHKTKVYIPGNCTCHWMNIFYVLSVWNKVVSDFDKLEF